MAINVKNIAICDKNKITPYNLMYEDILYLILRLPLQGLEVPNYHLDI
jgi:hypothetical protein